LLKQIGGSGTFFEAHDNFVFVEGNTEIVPPPSMLSKSLGFSVFDVENSKIIYEVAGPNPDRARNVNASTNFAVSPDGAVLAVGFGRALCLT
jgi:hypothetical protein